MANIARELALIYLSTSIHLYLLLYIYINILIYVHAYISCLHGISCSDPHLEHHSFPDLSIYIYLSIYLYTCVYLLFAWNQLQWPTLRTSLFWAFLSLSLKYLPIKRIVKQQNPQFGKIMLFWLMVLEFGQHHKRASPDLSIYIYSSKSIFAYIYMYIYIFMYVYYIYIYVCVYLFVCMESAAVTHT